MAERDPQLTPPLDTDPAFHVEQAISALHDAIWRVVRGIEVLDLEIISSARPKLDDATKSLLRSIELRSSRKGEEDSP